MSISVPAAVVLFSKRCVSFTLAPLTHSRQGTVLPQTTGEPCLPKRRRKASAGRKKPDAASQRIKALLRNKPRYCDERLAPDIDHKLLLALVRDKLPERTARDVYRFIISFKSWSDAYCDLLVREFRATQASSINNG